MSKLFSVAFLAAIFSLAAIAQTDQKYPFAGTWKLDVAKSTFSPGPAPKSATVTISEDRKVDFESESADGRQSKWSVTMKRDGTPAEISGSGGGTVTEKEISNRVVEHHWNTPDGITTGKAMLSKDGKTMIYTGTGKTADGKPIRNHEIWEKQ